VLTLRIDSSKMHRIPLRSLLPLCFFLTWAGLAFGADPVSKRPERLVSLVPALTETIYALEAESLLVGVSSYCNYPEAALQLPRVGSLMDPNWELILALEPDLLLLDQTDHNNQARAEALLIPTLSFDQASLAGVLLAFEKLGTTLDRPHAGRALAQGIESVLGNAMPSDDAPTVLLVADRVQVKGLPAQVWALGAGSWLSDLLVLAGGRNVLDKKEATAVLSTEGLIALDPDLVIELWPLEPGPPLGMRTWLKQWEKLPGWREEQRACALRGDVMLRPGPRLLEPFEAMQALLQSSKGGP
jgi:iron complex transport system substrate-binding protein